MVSMLLMWMACIVLSFVAVGICVGIRRVVEWLDDTLSLPQLLVALVVGSGVFSIAYHLGMTYG